MSEGKAHKAGAGGTWLTIGLVEMVIEPADVSGIVDTIIQIRRCVPLQSGSESEYGKRLRGRCARMVRTIGVRRGLGLTQLTKAVAAVFMTVALGVSFKALV